MELKKGDILKLKIEGVGSNGEGIAKAGGFPVFIKDAVVGDTCSIKITKVKKGYAYGHLLNVEIPSVHRVEASCPVAKRCGGCSIQAFAYDRQLKFKYDRVYECLKRIAGISGDVLDAAGEDTVGMEYPFRYRNKAQYPIGTDENGEIITGFFASRTHSIVPVTDCLLLPEEFQQILNSVTRFIKDHGISVYDERTNKGLFRHLLLKKAFATGEIMVVPVINGDNLEYEKEFIQMLRGFGAITTAVLNENTDPTNIILGQEQRILFGSGYITDILCGLKFRISPLSFYQVNPYIASRIYETVLEYAELTGKEEVWDVCCGIGTITLMLAEKAKTVKGIEIVEQAIEDAKTNAALNGIRNAEFICGAAEELLPGYVGERPDIIVTDPPRSGMERAAIDAIISVSPKKIIYVSCDPATMARDIKILGEAGYVLKRYRPFDQFCQTSHTEVCCLLTKTSVNRV